MSLPHEFHPLEVEDPATELPARLNNPFDYVPHPLCRRAVEEVYAHLALHPEWQEELSRGKMFGVLAVEHGDGQTGFLAAYSGNLDGRNDHPWFVPPVYDMLRPDGDFRREEAAISAINRHIAELESDGSYTEALDALRRAETEARERLAAFRTSARQAKILRDERRAAAVDVQILQQIDNESRREGSALRQLKAEVAERVKAAAARADVLQSRLDALKAERRHRSEQLQTMLFERFEVVSVDGRRKNLLEIFAPAMPPAGAGECAAPKLLQFAILNRLKPLSIAEFWYGRSPKGEVRRHGSFYPACRGKCKPILDFVLQGVELECRHDKHTAPEPAIIYEDRFLAIIDKPAGILSVEGKVDIPSVERWAKERYPESKVVHRLDMDVSGLLLIAKDLESYRRLQEQFLRRTVKKRYIALVEGSPARDEGEISLPMRPDPEDRPRQIVDPLHGKPALTRFRVKERREGCTLIEFEPVTGRTHQLRVHAAAADGLDTPIVGDTLYGARPGARLYLHNEFIAFRHPATDKEVQFLSTVLF